MILTEILQYVAIAILTFSLSSYIIKRNVKIRARGIKTAMGSQTTVYNKTKHLIPNDLRINNLPSQSKIHSEKYMIKVMVLEDNAYWVKDNIFFTANVEDGLVLPETTKQVDTLNMSKKDIDKMMVILDKLKEEEL